MFQPTKYGGPKLVCVDLTTDKVVKKILFPQDVALPTTYLNDVRFDLRRGNEGMAFITDSAQKGPNGIIVVDLASGTSWRRLHDHPSTKAEDMKTFLPIVEGRPFLEHQPTPCSCNCCILLSFVSTIGKFSSILSPNLDTTLLNLC